MDAPRRLESSTRLPSATGALSGLIVLDESRGQSAAALACYSLSLCLVLVGLLLVGRWPAILGDGDRECTICSARVARGASSTKGKASVVGEQKTLLGDPEAQGCWGWVMCAKA